MICCHILTNDEKADKFPCFKANAKAFEIQKRQNHYEIIARAAEQKEEEDEVINFLKDMGSFCLNYLAWKVFLLKMMARIILTAILCWSGNRLLFYGIFNIPVIRFGLNMNALRSYLFAIYYGVKI